MSITIVDRTRQARRYLVNANGTQILSIHGNTRAVRRIHTIMLHQTWLPALCDRGNEVDAFDRTIGHFVVTGNGTILQVREISAMLNDSRGGTAIHIEFVGHFVNDQGTHGNETPTISQIRVGRLLIAYLIKDIPEIASQIRYIVAHAQVSGMHRSNCPGPHIWYNVGKWAIQMFGLSSGAANAREISPSWETDRFGIPYSPGSIDTFQCRSAQTVRPGQLQDQAVQTRTVRMPGPHGKQ